MEIKYMEMVNFCEDGEEREGGKREGEMNIGDKM